MSKRKVEFFLFDIFIAILKIKEATKKFNSSQELLYSFLEWDTTIREFEIMGEASKFLIREKLLPKEYQIIVDFRNLITHKYFGIDEDIVWSIIQNDLPNFEKTILDIIRKIEPNLREELVNSFIKDNKHLDFITKQLKEIKK